MKTLSVCDHPLEGQSLIEASAGTGKTFTLALLYVRLVLGQGRSRLSPPDILVLTFTQAAAAELRDRIRRRLAEAAMACCGQWTPDPPLAEVLTRWRDQAQAETPHLDDEALNQEAALMLRAAADSLDEAAISTIHAWCLQMLQWQAFLTRMPRQVTLLESLQPQRLSALEDLWRRHFYGLDALAAAAVARTLQTPEVALAKLAPLLGVDPPTPVMAGAPVIHQGDAALDQVRTAQTELAQAAQALWAVYDAHGAADQALMQQAWDAGGLNKNQFRAASCAALWSSLAQRQLDEERLKLLTQDKLTRGCTKKGTPLTLALTPAVEGWLTAWAAAQRADQALTIGLLSGLAPALRALLAQETEDTGALGFDDLLVRLDAALLGPEGAALGDAVVRRYPVALIDECQDNDPVQFRVFSQLYEARPQIGSIATALLMIGDPKQAIYGFRGADLPTYLSWRDRVPTVVSLPTNFRSDVALVDGVNALLSFAERQPGGVFRARAQQPLPFQPVRAHRQAPGWWWRASADDDWQPAPPLVWATAEATPVKKSTALRQLAAAAADTMASWLNESAAGCRAWGAADARQPIRPGDIAVLVRSRFEAEAMRDALTARAIPTVFGSDREDVYQSPEAEQLALWMAAWHQPLDEQLLRTALATPLLGLSWSILAAWRDDEVAWSQQLDLALACQQRWQRQGVLAALWHWLFHHQVPAHCLQAPRGERALTNLLHLGELLQAAASTRSGPLGLMRFLAQQRQAAALGESSTALVRLESDSDRVRLITLHQSKGLEYPVVLLPFLTLPTSARDGWQVLTRYHEQTGAAERILETDPKTAREHSEDLQLQEDCRLAYVGLTRACHALWLPVMPVTLKGASQVLSGSVWSVWLAGASALPESEYAAHVERLAAEWQQQPGVQRTALSVSATPVRWQGVLQRPTLRPARSAPRLTLAPWSVASFSRLTHQTAPVAGSSSFDVPSANKPPSDRPRLPLSDTPRGRETGTFWHHLLEIAATHRFADTPASRALWRDAAERAVEAQQAPGWGPHLSVLLDQLPAWLSTPFALPHGGAVSLSGLDDFRVELSFWLSTQSVSITALDTLIHQHLWPGRARPQLTPTLWNGLLTGSIDVVFCAGGRYGVLDYKSNDLGPLADDYSPEALIDDVLHHRYDVQLSLYTVALHRHLQQRRVDYDPHQHLGGAVYLYLRAFGAPARSPDQGVMSVPVPVDLVLALDALCRGENRS